MLKIKTMRKLFFLVILLTQLGQAQSSDQAKRLLDKTATQMAAYDNMQFDFTYVLENQKEQIRQETNGKVTVEKEKFLLEIPEAAQLFDGQKKYTIIPENEEITITEGAAEDDLGFNPTALLNFYQEGYDFQMDILQKVMGKPIQFVKLTPQATDTGIDYLLLGIAVNTSEIYRIIEIGNNGTRTTLTIDNFQKNKTLAPGLFVFDASRYPDFYINQ